MDAFRAGTRAAHLSPLSTDVAIFGVATVGTAEMTLNLP